jgi:hypothetical protein
VDSDGKICGDAHRALRHQRERDTWQRPRRGTAGAPAASGLRNGPPAGWTRGIAPARAEGPWRSAALWRFHAYALRSAASATGIAFSSLSFVFPVS